MNTKELGTRRGGDDFPGSPSRLGCTTDCLVCRIFTLQEEHSLLTGSYTLQEAYSLLTGSYTLQEEYSLLTSSYTLQKERFFLTGSKIVLQWLCHSAYRHWLNYHRVSQWFLCAGFEGRRIITEQIF